MTKEKGKIKEEIDRCEAVIKAGERYERLMSNSDFRSMLKDLDDTVRMHQVELDNLDEDLIKAETQEKMFSIVLARKIHLERSYQIKQAIRRPEMLVNISRHAQETLDELKKKQKELINA